MPGLAMTTTNNADGTATYTFTMTTEKPLKHSEVKAELLDQAGFSDEELYHQLHWQLDGAVCMFVWDDVMNASEASSEEEAAEWWDERGGSWSTLEDEMCMAGNYYLENL